MKAVYKNYDGYEMEEDDVVDFIRWKMKSLMSEGLCYDGAYEHLFSDQFFVRSFIDNSFLKKIKTEFKKP